MIESLLWNRLFISSSATAVSFTDSRGLYAMASMQMILSFFCEAGRLCFSLFFCPKTITLGSFPCDSAFRVGQRACSFNFLSFLPWSSTTIFFSFSENEIKKLNLLRRCARTVGLTLLYMRMSLWRVSIISSLCILLSCSRIRFCFIGEM